MEPAANDPFFDRILTAIHRYTVPVAIVGMIFFLAVVAWLFSL